MQVFGYSFNTKSVLQTLFTMAYTCALVLAVIVYPAAASVDDLEDQFKQLFKEAYIPGASVAILRDGEIVHSLAYGDANRATGSKVNPETLFEAASLSKALFAPIVLQLVEEGKLQLDRPLYRYFKQPLPDIEDYKAFAEDERYKQLTARVVLSHTSGLPNWRSQNDGKLAFTSDPGEAFTYSGEGFQLLQLAVERITDKSLEELAKDRIFQPLDMRHSSYVLTEAQAETAAHGHRILGMAAGKWPVESGYSAFSLHSNANEYARFIQAILRNELLSEASHRILLSPQSQQLKDDERPFTMYWGLGLAVHVEEGKTYFWHGGSNSNFKALAVAELQSGDGVVFFSNTDLGEYIFPELVDIALPNFGLSHEFMLSAFSNARFTDGLKLGLALTEMPFAEATKPFRNERGELTINGKQLSDIAIELSETGMDNVASLLIKESVLQYSDNEHINYAAGILAMRAGNYDAARRSMQKALQLNPGLTQANRVLKGLALAENGGDSTFVLNGFNDASLVTLAGTFNDWHPMSIPLKKNADGWRINIALPSGEHYYKFIVDGEWMFDPDNVKRGEFGGIMNSLLVID